MVLHWDGLYRFRCNYDTQTEFKQHRHIYSIIMNTFRVSLINDCKELIEGQFIRTAHFSKWLNNYAGPELNSLYQDTFELSMPLSNDTEAILWVLSKNLLFSIHSFIEYKNDVSWDELQYFVERFLENQLGDEQIWNSFIN